MGPSSRGPGAEGLCAPRGRLLTCGPGHSARRLRASASSAVSRLRRPRAPDDSCGQVPLTGAAPWSTRGSFHAPARCCLPRLPSGGSGRLRRQGSTPLHCSTTCQVACVCTQTPVYTEHTPYVRLRCSVRRACRMEHVKARVYACLRHMTQGGDGNTSISLEQLSGTYCVLSTVPLDLRRSLEGWPCTAVALDGRRGLGRGWVSLPRVTFLPPVLLKPRAPTVTFIWGFTEEDGGKTESGRLQKVECCDGGGCADGGGCGCGKARWGGWEQRPTACRSGFTAGSRGGSLGLPPFLQNGAGGDRRQLGCRGSRPKAGRARLLTLSAPGPPNVPGAFFPPI